MSLSVYIPHDVAKSREEQRVKANSKSAKPVEFIALAVLGALALLASHYAAWSQMLGLWTQ